MCLYSMRQALRSCHSVLLRLPSFPLCPDQLTLPTGQVQTQCHPLSHVSASARPVFATLTPVFLVQYTCDLTTSFSTPPHIGGSGVEL